MDSFLILVFAFPEEGTDRSAEVGTTRFIVLTLSPFLNAIVDPFIVLRNLGASDAIARALRQRCVRCPPYGNPDPPTNDMDLTTGHGLNTTVS
ncbi:hypothetical protein ACOMHN_021205 [Nucella lapillus]